LKNKNRSDYTIKTTNKALTRINENANINDPEKVEQFISNIKNVSNGYKKLLCLAYKKYCYYYKLEWEMPSYKQEEKLRRIPTTENLNMLIAKAYKPTSLKLSISKETGLRPIELCNLKVMDIDLERKTIYPTTAKNGSARTLKISNCLKSMLTDHINTRKLQQNDKLFTSTPQNYGKCYGQLRNRLALKLGNPTLQTIRLYDFRHYFATRLYAKTTGPTAPHNFPNCVLALTKPLASASVRSNPIKNPRIPIPKRKPFIAVTSLLYVKELSI
jgi:integrase